MKKIILVLACCILLFSMVGCNNSTEEITQPEVNVEITDPFVTTYCVKDAHGNIIKHILFNKNTRLTYVYDYQWEYDYGVFVCTNQWLTIIDEKGREVEDTVDVEINGCPNMGNCGDAYNDVYPQYQQPQCDKNTTTTDSNIKPCIVYKDANISITIISANLEDTNHFSYELKVENYSNKNLSIHIRANEYNDCVTVNDFLCGVDVNAGKIAYEDLVISDYALEDAHIDDLRSVKLQIVASADNWNTYIVDTETIIEFE